MALDLGGIAKGYAVDHAVARLRASGAAAGLVNAGGDLRVFGQRAWIPIRIRHSADPAMAAALFEVQDAAVATSGDYFRREGLFDPRSRRARAYGGSITVVAPSCTLADALTKIVALTPAGVSWLLAAHGAQAFRMQTASGTLRCLTAGGVSPAHLRMLVAAAA